MQALIPGLRGSLTHRMSAELYQRHHDAGNGACRTCGYRTPCPPRRHAISVIVAAGEDPLSYDARSPNGVTPAGDTPHGGEEHRPHRPATTTATLRAHTGYHLGGRGRPGTSDGFVYDRDSL